MASSATPLYHLEEFRGESKFSTWLVQIALYEACRFRRRNRKQRWDSINAGHEDQTGTDAPHSFAEWREIPSEALVRKELQDTVGRVVASLKPIYRDVVILHCIRHFSVQEMAQKLKVSQAIVKLRLLRARLQMPDVLAPSYDGSGYPGQEEERH